ncbi:hypothetical protein COY07_03160 [Candidatus Peregrinibacteria bacterium CG_4_10_14_0_2_um_filter_43_11]|nr:MAG: hypothetical protein COY07_03160 [Candidatus Peregrinibacteria bacterium CG_4_10_14_0_2_um_filter_43_11]
MILQKVIFSKHLEGGEDVLFAVHKHWVKILGSTLEIAFFGFLIPWGLYVIGLNTELFFWVAVVWSAMAYLRFLYVLIDWYTDVWLVTGMSIIVIEWKGFFTNQSTRIGYEDIEGVAYEINGFFATVLGYGDLMLKVMSGSNYEIKSAIKPRKAELAIMRFQDEYVNNRESMDSSNLKTLLSEMVARHMREKNR